MIFAVPYTLTKRDVTNRWDQLRACVALIEAETATEAEQRTCRFGDRTRLDVGDAVELDISALTREQSIEVWRGEVKA